MKPTLLCYHLTGERGRKIRFAAMGLSILIRNVGEEEYGKPIAALCGGETAAEDIPPQGSFSDEMIVMAGFPDALVSRLLQAIRMMKLQPVQLKAILTETNAKWNSVRLHQELCAEREAFLLGKTLSHDGVQPE